MITTQVNMTESENEILKSLAIRTGKTEDELIRKAVERLLSEVEAADRLSLLRQARGIWKDREDLTDVRMLRSEFDRYESAL